MLNVRSEPKHARPSSFPWRPVRRALAVVVIAALAGLLAMALTSGHTGRQPAHQQAVRPAAAVVLTAVTCKTTHTYTETVSSAGTVRQKWETKSGCGTHWQEWVRIISRSTSGAHYTEIEYLDHRSYPHTFEDMRKWSWTAKGVETYTHTVITS